jgi:tetratricopeptide (TPR) repeat protein
MITLAETYRLTGNLDRVLPLLEETLKLAKAKLGPDDPRTAVAMARLGDNLVCQNNKEAVPLLRASLAVLQKKESDAWTLSTQSVLGGCLLRLHKDEEAEPLLRACLAVRQKKEPDAWTTFNTQSELGGSLLGQKKYEEAERLLLAGFEGMQKRGDKIPPPAKVHLAEAAERLVRLYDALNRPDKAGEWREKEKAAKAAAKSTNKPAPNPKSASAP